MLAAFGLGFLWMTLTGVQTRLLVKTRSELLLVSWTAMTSIVWGLLVRTVMIDQAMIVPYAVGTALGIWIARKIVTNVIELL